MSKKKTGAEKIRWGLNELFSGLDDPKIEAVFITAREKADSFSKKYKGKIVDLAPLELKAALEKKAGLLAPIYQLSQYVSLNYAINSTDEKVKALVDKIDTFESEIANKILFFALELGALPLDIYKKFENAPELKDYAYPIYMAKKTAKYHLSEKEEKVVNLKNLSGTIALKKLYQELTTSFEFEFEVEAELKRMNGSELRAMRYHQDPKIRRRAMKIFFDKYAEHELTITHLFNAILKDHNTEREMRKYISPISIMNVHNDLKNNIVETLHLVTNESYHLVHRYYQLKAKILGLRDMTLADIYAPMPESKSKYTWDESKKIVLKGFQDFDDEFYTLAKLMFTKKRIDAPVLKNKRGGAFCSSSTPDLDPYVMLNFLGQERDVATMAHELGHAIHSMLSKGQNLYNFHSILPLAETASVFGEMLITDLLLKKEKDKNNKIAILTSKLEDIFATSHRQNMFSTFEQAAHKLVEERRASAKELNEIYFQGLKKMFGNSIKYTDEYKWEWASIPHMFEVPFYVYAYNFGNLLVMALYEMYQEEGKSFIPKFKKMLAAGSSASPKDITAITGADISNPDFWRKSLKYIEGKIDELEGLLT
ncbi:M3 family oligoendopeptidase [Candidatus Margulisiibacteriota bacterium]